LHTVLVTKPLPTEVAHDHGHVRISGVQMAGGEQPAVFLGLRAPCAASSAGRIRCQPEIAEGAVADAASASNAQVALDNQMTTRVAARTGGW
jgi:hypothetical protein